MNNVNLVGTLTKDARIIKGTKRPYLRILLETPHGFRPADEAGDMRLLVPLYVFNVPEEELTSLKEGDTIAVTNGKVNMETVTTSDSSMRHETSVKTSWQSVRKL